RKRSSFVDRNRLSRFGNRFLGGAGSYQLMADLGAAAERPDTLMLGGGNPARIPAVEDVLRRELHYLAEQAEMTARWGAGYSAPEGDIRCRDALAEMLSSRYGWAVSRKNIAFTSGSQMAFFMLFNAFAGESLEGRVRSVLLP